MHRFQAQLGAASRAFWRSDARVAFFSGSLLVSASMTGWTGRLGMSLRNGIGGGG